MGRKGRGEEPAQVGDGLAEEEIVQSFKVTVAAVCSDATVSGVGIFLSFWKTQKHYWR